MRRPLLLLSTGSLCLLALFASCSEKLAKQTSLSAADLFSRGQQKFAAKKYVDAAEAFQVLLERFPASPLAAKAQLGLAEARMENKDHIEAEVAYDDFVRLYPADDNVAYALYRKGDLLARQSPDISRDQTKTQEALKAFQQSREKSPSGPYAEKAAARVRELRDRLAKHDLLVVDHYLRRKHYAGAEARARRTLTDYPDTAAAPTVMARLAEALEKQGKKAEAAEVRKTKEEKFPDPGRKAP